MLDQVVFAVDERLHDRRVDVWSGHGGDSKRAVELPVGTLGEGSVVETTDLADALTFEGFSLGQSSVLQNIGVFGE